MARLEATEAVRRAAGYGHAVLSWIEADGYPVSVAGSFAAAGTSVEVGPVAAELLPAHGQEVCVTFSHIRPQPGVGYDQRRYVNLWGAAEVSEGGHVRVVVERASGWDEADTPFVEYAERNVGAGLSYLSEMGARPRLSAFWRFFLATRVPFLTATLVPVGLAGAVAAYDGGFAFGWWLLALVCAVCAHLGLNIANDLADAEGSDAVNVTPTPFSGGSRVMQYGLVSKSQMLALSLGCYGVTILTGLWLAAARSWWLLVIGVIALVLSVGYSAAPLRLVHRGLGEPVVALGFGPIMAGGAYLAVTQAWSWPVVYASLPIGILIALVLYVNQIPDRIADAQAAKRTLTVRWPKDRVIQAYAIAVAVAMLLILVGPLLGITPWWTLLGLLPLPLAVPVLRGMRRSYDAPFGLLGAMGYNILLHLTTGVLLIVGYLVAAVTG